MATGSFKPATVRLIEGKTELLPGLDIVSKLYIGVEFGRNRFRAGRGELGMMTFNEKRHWVFPLVPTDWAYAKLDGYFGKLQKSEIEALQVQGDFGGHLEVRKVNKTKNRWLGGKMGKFKAAVSDVGDTIRNTFARMANALSGSDGPKLTRRN